MLTKVDILGLREYAPMLLLDAGGSIGSDPLQILDIQGIGPVKASIITTAYGVVDGESYVGASVGKRNIVLTIGLNPDWSIQTVEELRLLLYNYFMPKLFTRLRFTSTHLPTCEIDGVVESMEPNIFSKDPQIQVSIICSKPDFVAMTETTVTGLTNDGNEDADFTAIDYVGSIPTGFTLKVARATGDPGENTVGLILKSEYPQQTFEARGILSVTQFFEMCSVPGNKYVRTVTVADPASYLNYLGSVAADAVWPVILPNANQLAVVTPVVAQDWELSYFARFGGL